MKIVLITGGCLLALLFSLLSVPWPNPAKSHEAHAVAGVLNISADDFASGKLTRLSGEWEFYWGRLLTAADFTKSNPPTPDYYSVPKLWNSQTRSGIRLQGKGFATYRLKVKLPRPHFGIGIELPNLHGYAKVYINGELIRQLGSIDEVNKVTVAGGRGHFVNYVSERDSIDIVIQAVNYSIADGGMKSSGRIGDTTAVFNARSIAFAIDSSVIAIMLYMALYNLSMAVIRKRFDSNIWLSMFAFLFIIRTLIVGQSQIARQFSFLDGTWIWRIEIVTYYLSLPLWTAFINSLFPQETNSRYTRITLALVIPFSLVTLVSQPDFFSPAKVFIQILQVALSVVYAGAILRAIKHQQDGARVFFAGYVMLAVFSLLEVVTLYTMADIPRLSMIGTVIFAGFQSIFLARRHNNAFRAAEASERKVRELYQEIIEQDRARLELTRIETEKSMLKASMAEAQAFYSSLGDSGKSIPGLQVATHLQAAEIAGGDWLGVDYDRNNNVAYIAIADVTGHDMLSALVTVAAIGAFKGATAALKSQKRQSELSVSLTQIMATINEAVRDAGKKSDRMMTMALVALDLATGEAVYANAGHTPLLLANNGTIKALMSQNNPLGLTEHFEVKWKSLHLEAGDSLFLYTDGLLDNEGPDGVKLKARELRRILTEVQSSDEAHRMIVGNCQTIWQDTPQKDDSSFVHVRWQEPVHLITGDAV